eukprot:1070246-Pyramimonas_sp.AAC.1
MMSQCDVGRIFKAAFAFCLLRRPRFLPAFAGKLAETNNPANDLRTRPCNSRPLLRRHGCCRKTVNNRARNNGVEKFATK